MKTSFCSLRLLLTLGLVLCCAPRLSQAHDPGAQSASPQSSAPPTSSTVSTSPDGTAKAAERKRRFEEEKKRLEGDGPRPQASSQSAAQGGNCQASPDDLMLSPNFVNMLVGETQRFSLFDFAGHKLAPQADWSVSDSSIADLAVEGGVPVLTSKRTGTIHVTARVAARSVEATINVITPQDMKPGTVQWSSPTTPCAKPVGVVPAVGSFWPYSADQRTSAAHATVASVLDRMKSPDPAERVKAFYDADQLLASGTSTPHDIDRLKVGIIELLIAENARINLPDEELAKQATTATGCGNGTDNCEGGEEGESEYYPSLIATVAGLNDERAIPALAGAMIYASYARKALLTFGDKAVGTILDQLKSRNALLRASALSMAVSMGGQNKSVSPPRIREMLRSALTDPVAVVRSNAVKEIACLDDRQDFVPALEKLAKTDPVHWKGRADDGVDGDEFYPVRFDARRALREIQNNQPCLSRRP